MLTGPITILRWSFPRDDVPQSVQAKQLGLALRDEVSTWEDIASQLNDLHGLAELLEEEPDQSMQAEIVESVAELEKTYGIV